MAYHLASTEQEIRTPFQGGFRPVGGLLARNAMPAPAVPAPRQAEPMPKGTGHAVADQAKQTVCGLNVATLYDFPAIAWPPSGVVRCLMCRHWVDTGVPE